MRKRIFIISVICILILMGWRSPLRHTLGFANSHEKNLQEAFQVTGTTLKDITFSGWVQINKSYSTEEELKEIAQRLAQGLAQGLGAGTGSLVEITQREDSLRGYVLRGKLNKNISVEIYCQSMKGNGQEIESPETYLTAVVSMQQGLDQLDGWKKRINTAFYQVSKEPIQLSTIITGTMGGPRSTKEMKEIAVKVFDYFDTEPFEGVVNSKLVSLTGYTKVIDEEMTAGDKKFNLNVALRNNSTDGKTYLIIGSPIIAMEY